MERQKKMLDLGYQEMELEKYLFPALRKRTPKDKPMSRQGVNSQIKRSAGVGSRASIHSFRKLFAQRIYKRTGSIKDVQKALQHSRIDITYTYLDIEMPP